MERTAGEAREKSALVRRRPDKLNWWNANGAENPAPFLRPFPGEKWVFLQLQRSR